MANHEEAVEHPKSRGRHREEIHRRNHVAVVLLKNQPALSGIRVAAQPSQVPGNRALGNLQPQFQ